MENELRFALLIDADNVSDKYIKIILDETSANGTITYKRIYGDWTNPKLSSWKKVLLESSIIPIQQYSYTTGKNATDSAMIIDAMDILYSGAVEGFCLVSSDSDFTRLAARLRESGMVVIGMGESKTPQPFISACNQFKYLDKLYAERLQETEEEAEAEAETEEQSTTDLSKVKKTIRSIVKKFSDEEGWILSGKLGDQLSKRLPDFDVRNYGYTKLSLFMKSLGEYETTLVSNGGHQKQMYYRLKVQKNNKSTRKKPAADKVKKISLEEYLKGE